MNQIKKILYRGRRYKVVQRDGLNVLEETDASRAKRSELREVVNICLTFISAIAAIVAAVFAALTYINS